MSIYHFTCTARLPWIVEAAELRPGRKQIGGYPVDFLWATSSSQGDRTASGMVGYRARRTALVRLTVQPADFERWPDILQRFPQWTAEHAKRLEAGARLRGQTDFSGWRARAELLPLSRIVGIEAKTFDGKWTVIELQDACLRAHRESTARGVRLNGTVYLSIQHQAKAGHATQYSTARIPATEWAALGEHAAAREEG